MTHPRVIVVPSEEFFKHFPTGQIGMATGCEIPGNNTNATQKLLLKDGTTGEFPITELVLTAAPAGHKPRFPAMVFTERVDLS